ncbi:MAG: aminopeptidase [Deltaproteobacteria bacterium]|nr:aminopeptidase [Deltaproteobacteria bacterium]
MFAVSAMVALAGCSAAYVVRAGYEEAKILWRREPMARVLARGDLDADVRRKLETVLAARTFAMEIGLDVDGSFGSLSYSDREANVFVVTAAKRSALEQYTWWFPIVGSVPYKGFFDPQQASAEAAALEARGYDTYVRTAAAFSTLGWFADPLLRHLLRYDEEFLVDLVLHEVYHNTFYLRGQAAFNESLATFVGHRGAIAFFRAHPERAHPAGEDDLAARANATWDDARRFGAFVSRLATLLRGVYADAADPAQTLAARDTLFAQARAEYRALPFANGGFPSFVAEPLNNAVLLYYLLYGTDLDLFETIYHARGDDLGAAIAFIQAAAKTAPSDPFGAVRRAFEEHRGTIAAGATAAAME